jgi:hypothetical protein
MKKIIPFLIVIAFAGCAKKEWSKDYLVKKCNKEMKKNSDINGKVSDENLGKICDCVADKMITNYKSESEANKDESGAQKIGTDCAMEVLMPTLPE